MLYATPVLSARLHGIVGVFVRSVHEEIGPTRPVVIGYHLTEIHSEGKTCEMERGVYIR